MRSSRSAEKAIAKKAIISTTRFHTRICENPARLMTIANPPIVPSSVARKVMSAPLSSTELRSCTERSS